MRRTRFMSLLFLALSVAFFLLQDFRWALQLPLAMTFGEAGRIRTGLSGSLGRRRLLALKDAAAQRGDAQGLAFVALHLPEQDREEAFRLAEQAVAGDSGLTWLYYHVSGIYRDAWQEPAVAERVQGWITKLRDFDRDNAIPYLLQAEFIRRRAKDWPEGNAVQIPGQGWPYLKSLAGQTEWRAAMALAMEQPRFDSYNVKRFDLERGVLREQGWESPAVMLLSAAGYQLPNLLNIREYAQFEVKHLAAEAEQAGRRDEALERYYRTAAFGQLLRLQGTSLIEKLIGIAVDLIGSEPLLSALKKAGRQQEARLLELRVGDLKQGAGLIPRQDPLALSSIHYWSGLLLHLLFLQVVFFAALTLLAILYVNAKRWVRPQRRGRLYQVMTVAENYMPILLFVSCMALYMVYAPYAHNFRHYMVARGEIRNMEPLFYNVFPAPWFLPSFLYLPMENPFRTYVYWALAAVALVALLAGWEERRAREKSASAGPAGPGA